MEGTVRTPITLFPLQIITKTESCSIRGGVPFVIAEGQFVWKLTDVMHAIAICHLSAM